MKSGTPWTRQPRNRAATARSKRARSFALGWGLRSMRPISPLRVRSSSLLTNLFMMPQVGADAGPHDQESERQRRHAAQHAMRMQQGINRDRIIRRKESHAPPRDLTRAERLTQHSPIAYTPVFPYKEPPPLPAGAHGHSLCRSGPCLSRHAEGASLLCQLAERGQTMAAHLDHDA